MEGGGGSMKSVLDMTAAVEVGALVGTALLDIGRTIPFVAPVTYAIGTIVSLAQTGRNPFAYICQSTVLKYTVSTLLTSVCISENAI